jgi:hypothetical protein
MDINELIQIFEKTVVLDQAQLSPAQQHLQRATEADVPGPGLPKLSEVQRNATNSNGRDRRPVFN